MMRRTEDEELDKMQARYDRKVAQRRRLLAYHDGCPDGDRRKYDCEQEMIALGRTIAEIEEQMDAYIKAHGLA
jgi:hypothetical protein